MKDKAFTQNTTNLINLSIELAEEMLNDAISKMREGEKASIPLNQLSSFIGTLYDRRAQAENGSFENASVKIALPGEVKKYAE